MIMLTEQQAISLQASYVYTLSIVSLPGYFKVLSFLGTLVKKKSLQYQLLASPSVIFSLSYATDKAQLSANNVVCIELQLYRTLDI